MGNRYLIKSNYQILRFILVFIFLFLLFAASAGCSSNQDAGGDSSPQAGEEIYIENKGSDTIVNLALAWAERYQDLHSDIRISVTGGGLYKETYR